MEKEKSMDVDLTIVSSSEGGDGDSNENKTPRKRNLDACEASLMSEKKSHLDQDSMVVVQLQSPLEDGGGDVTQDHKMVSGSKSDMKGALHHSAAEYFEFIKGPGGDDFSSTSQLMEKVNKSPADTQSTNSDGSSGDRDCVSSSQQQYYIAVDARTVATLQAGAEYTLVPVDQGGKPVPVTSSEERNQSGYDEERMWVSGEAQLKNADQPQQLLMQTMRPLNSAPGSPLPHCQSDDNASGQPTSSDSFSGAAMFGGNSDGNSSPQGKSNGAAGSSVGQTPSVMRGCTPMVQQVKYDGQPRFSTPTTSHNGYPIMATPHPHLLYNMATTPHHPGSSGTYAYSGHRLHLPTASPAWHTSPFSQTFSPHSGQGFLNSQNSTSVSNLSLNSSGEENENVSPEYPRVPHNTPNTDGALFPITAIPRTPNMSQILGPLDNMQYFPIPYTGRENHNEKERKRRSRIKNACSLLRDLVPGLSEKTDKATVFEYTVQYLLHLKRHVGKQFDKVYEEISIEVE